MIAKLGEILNEDFTVIDSDRELVTGLVNGDFTKNLFDPSGNEVSGVIGITISELGNGHYRATLTLNEVGTWYMVVYHSTYFPWGKQDYIQVFNNGFDSIGELITRILGLTQENQYIDNASYDDDNNLVSCRIRIYDDQTKVGTGSNVVATYLVTAGYTDNLLDYYKVVKQ